eukprot:jgi/Galph1/3058/GphlegSOOS_G1741.1
MPKKIAKRGIKKKRDASQKLQKNIQEKQKREKRLARLHQKLKLDFKSQKANTSSNGSIEPSILISKKHAMEPYEDDADNGLEKLQKLLVKTQSSQTPRGSASEKEQSNSESSHVKPLFSSPTFIEPADVDKIFDESHVSMALEREQKHFESLLPPNQNVTEYDRKLMNLSDVCPLEVFIPSYRIDDKENCIDSKLKVDFSSLGMEKKLFQRLVAMRKESKLDCLEPMMPCEFLASFACLHWTDCICELTDFFSQLRAIRPIYLVHAISHIFRSRRRIIQNNMRISKQLSDTALSNDDSLKDQGFTRPKILILLPMKNFAYQVVSLLVAFLTQNDKDNFGYKLQIHNYDRFVEEYYLSEEEDLSKPLDYRETFRGNVDDDFCLGIKVGGKYLQLYSDVYGSDFIIGSPLGIRRLIEGKDESEVSKKSGADFLSNIEICIVEAADVMDMQNWDHVQFVFERLNQLPKTLHGADISRISQRALDGTTKFYRQSIFVTNYVHSNLLALFRKYCCNIEGKVRNILSHPGVLFQPVDKTQVRHCFERLKQTPNILESSRQRLTYFQQKLFSRLFFPSYKMQTLIFIPSYFDYVQIRNFCYNKQKAGELTFGTFCEYSTDSHILAEKKALVESRFCFNDREILFYRRETIPEISCILFYQAPEHAHFYEELVRSLKTSEQIPTVHILYDSFDYFPLERIVGTTFCKELMKNKSLYVWG